MSLKRDRMNDRIRQILSELLRREVSDPRLQGVTVTEVVLDPELLFARVYVNALGDETRQKDVLEGLKSASGFLRRETGKHIRLRNTPELHFYWDTTLERGERLNQILDTLEIPLPDEDELDDALIREDEDDELD